MTSIPIIGQIVDRVLGIIDQIVPDRDLADKLKAEYSRELLRQDFALIDKEIEAKAGIIAEEIRGQSWAQRNWRPLLMLTIVAIIANNFLLFPYLSLFTSKTTMLDFPEQLWSLMQIGVGGYVVGRTVEKGIKTWKTGQEG